MSWGASHAVTFFNACLQIHLTHRVGYWVSESYVPYGLCNFCAAEKFLLSCTVLLCQALANLVVNHVLVPFSEVLLQWYTMLGDRDVKLGQCLTKLIESCLKLLHGWHWSGWHSLTQISPTVWRGERWLWSVVHACFLFPITSRLAQGWRAVKF